jgi:hypothetical protein
MVVRWWVRWKGKGRFERLFFSQKKYVSVSRLSAVKGKGRFERLFCLAKRNMSAYQG